MEAQYSEKFKFKFVRILVTHPIHRLHRKVERNQALSSRELFYSSLISNTVFASARHERMAAVLHPNIR